MTAAPRLTKAKTLVLDLDFQLWLLPVSGAVFYRDVYGNSATPLPVRAAWPCAHEAETYGSQSLKRRRLGRVRHHRAGPGSERAHALSLTCKRRRTADACMIKHQVRCLLLASSRDLSEKQASKGSAATNACKRPCAHHRRAQPDEAKSVQKP